MTTAPGSPAGLASIARALRTPRPGATPRQATQTWHYPPDGFALGVLARLRRESAAALRDVDYADNFGAAATHARFRRAGDATVVEVPGGALSSDGAWEVEVDGAWVPTDVREGDTLPPHAQGEPVTRVVLRILDGVWTAPAPVLGHVLVTAPTPPVIGVGESVEEALATANEADLTMEPAGDGLWRSRHELGLRYVSAPHATAVEVEARVRPVDERGAFACADERLSRVWAVAAATLHTSMQVLTVDGIKRDRLPWQGDQALAATANAYAFGDAAIARDGLIALGRPRHGFVNGIADYSLWWLVNIATLLTHFGVDPLVGEGAAIDDFASALWQQRDEAGLLRPAPGEHFRGADAEGVFIDWGAPVRGSDATAFQLLWAWALAATADTLDALGHDTAGAWRQRADEVAATVTRLAWDDDAGLWHDRVDRSGTGSAHPNVIAAVSGIGPSSPRMAATIRDGEVGTPFMRSYALTALHRLGDTAAALDELTDRWGRQLDRGALTFSEDFDVEGESPFAMYGRPFGRSMSHAWSSAPASLLPQLLLGLRPLAPGWAAFSIRPQLGDLAWAGATVPTPHGDVTVIADTRTVRAWLPAGTTLLDGDTRVTGPAVHERPAA